jgi:CDP-6-deoxy-D-xylo-4-hexulose-3-dehydrase
MMTIKLVSDTIDRSDVDALVAWLQQEPIPRLTKGELTIQLENKWNQWLGVRHTTYVNSGSSAILLALAAMQEAGMLKPGARVAVPGLSWLTDVSSVMLLGMKPVLIDCNLTDLSMDLDHLENEIKARGVAAVILVSVLGLVPNMDKIVKLCKKHGVKLIEDV